MKVGFADDLILAAKSKEALEQTLSICMTFFEERLLILNKTKSEILIIGPRFGRKMPSMVMGIKVKRQAKYLGINYNVDLNINYSLKSFKPKINYICYRLYRMLRMADFRTRYNLWQVFVMPLIRMVISSVGDWNSRRC
jgi:hypothetical protein